MATALVVGAKDSEESKPNTDLMRKTVKVWWHMLLIPPLSRQISVNSRIAWALPRGTLSPNNKDSKRERRVACPR